MFFIKILMMVLDKKVINNLLKKCIVNESEMQIEEQTNEWIIVNLKLKLKEVKETKKEEDKKEMNKKEFYDWAEKFEARFFGEINKINQRLDRIEERLDKVEKRLDDLERRMDAVEKRLDALEKRMDAVEKRLDNIEWRLSRIERCPTIQKELSLLKD